VSDQIHALDALPPGTHWIGGWVGPRMGVDDVERRKILSLFDSHYHKHIPIIYSFLQIYTDHKI
jgi:hypothetical protein